MTRLKDMLEPGERVLVRSTDGKTTWYLAGFFLLMLAAGWLRGVWGVELLGFRFWKATLALLTFAPLIIGVAWLWTRWRWVITDRRVLKRYGMFSSDIGEMRNETVDEVRLRDKALSIHGRDYRWDFTISGNFCRADILYDLFGARAGDPGLPARPLADMLEPGETVLWRAWPVLAELLPWVIPFSGPLAFAALLIWPESAEFLYGSPILVLTFYVMLLAHIVAAWRRRGWQTVLTDRRLLRRRPEAPSRCDAIPLDAVTGAQWDRKDWELAVVSPGRRDKFFCFPWTARRILDALERNDRGEALA